MKPTNKFIGTMIIFFMTMLALTACSPEDGKDGKDGLDGQPGPMGNANVTLYEFEDTYNFAATSEFMFTCDSTIEDAENSLWQAFMVSASQEYYSYSIPGYGYQGNSFYRLALSILNQTELWIQKQSGPGEVYVKVRIFRILANNTGATNRTIGKLYNGYTEEEVRAMSYDEFANAFGLSD